MQRQTTDTSRDTREGTLLESSSQPACESHSARIGLIVLALASLVLSASCQPAAAADPATSGASAAASEDVHVDRFLEEQRRDWPGHSVPFEDGRLLHDMVVENGYTSILEIGTSEGHSTVWLAWAARKTGGKVVSIEIDAERHRRARANLEAAGLIDHVELVLGDAHELVPALEPDFDLVFSDADKDWYTQYFEDIRGHIPVGGCMAAHNALNGFPGVERYIEHVKKQAEFETRIEHSSKSGFAISCRKAPVE